MTEYFVDINGELNRPPGGSDFSSSISGSLSGASGSAVISTITRVIGLGASARLWLGSLSSVVHYLNTVRSLTGSQGNFIGALTKFRKRPISITGTHQLSGGDVSRKAGRSRLPSASPQLFLGSATGTTNRGLAFVYATMGILSGSLARVFKRPIILAGSFTWSGIVSAYKYAVSVYYSSIAGGLTMSGLCNWFRSNPSVNGSLGFSGNVEIYRGALYYGTIPE